MRLAVILLLTATVVSVFAKIRTEAVPYQDGDTVLEGYLVYDDAVTVPRPAVLVCHEWWGLVDFAKQRAEQLAALGYVAFALDMYGKGVTAKTAEEAMAKAGPFYENRERMRQRANAGLKVLKHHPRVDARRIAVIGYCFGGTCALEVARSGADIVGAVSFHGGLKTPHPDDAKNIKGKVLVLNGADDPYVKPEDIAAFEQEMRVGGVEWEFVNYGGAVHAFTNPAAGNDPAKGAAYNEQADQRSWQAMKSFLEDVFK